MKARAKNRGRWKSIRHEAGTHPKDVAHVQLVPNRRLTYSSPTLMLDNSPRVNSAKRPTKERNRLKRESRRLLRGVGP